MRGKAKPEKFLIQKVVDGGRWSEKIRVNVRGREGKMRNMLIREEQDRINELMRKRARRKYRETELS